MSDSGTMRCCGRPMTVIGVADDAQAVRLHSCPSCGRHAWRQGDQVVDRSQLLDALRVSPAPRRRAAPEPAAVKAAPPAPAEADEPAAERPAGLREELQRMLSGFTVHGRSS